jgi:aryl-alcohol dehydrogenase-like predicted oxidoreductase
MSDQDYVDFTRSQFTYWYWQADRGKISIRSSVTIKEIDMRYRLLGNSGLRVSEAALGAMTFGDDWGWGAAKKEARKLYDAFREAGGNFINMRTSTRTGRANRSLASLWRATARAALAWLRYHPVPVIPIIGARKLSQLQDNLASLEVMLSADQLKTLDEASRIELGFPYDMYAKEMARAVCYGGLRDQILA